MLSRTSGLTDLQYPSSLSLGHRDGTLSLQSCVSKRKSKPSTDQVTNYVRCSQSLRYFDLWLTHNWLTRYSALRLFYGELVRTISIWKLNYEPSLCLITYRMRFTFQHLKTWLVERWKTVEATEWLVFCNICGIRWKAEVLLATQNAQLLLHACNITCL